MTYHQIIKEERRKQRMTQEEIAKRLGLSQTHYSKIERGETKMLVDDLIRICKILGIRPGSLLNNDQ